MLKLLVISFIFENIVDKCSSSEQTLSSSNTNIIYPANDRTQFLKHQWRRSTTFYGILGD